MMLTLFWPSIKRTLFSVEAVGTQSTDHLPRSLADEEPAQFRLEVKGRMEDVVYGVQGNGKAGNSVFLFFVEPAFFGVPVIFVVEAFVPIHVVVVYRL
jgi:hypothetical protein